MASLTGAKVLGAASGFATGPLLARALGASGRGDLAAVLVPLSVAPAILGFGVGAYAFRALPRGRSVEKVLGSLGLPLLVIGMLSAALAVPMADVVAGGRETVRTLLIVVFLAMPLLLVVGLLYASVAALERWRALFAMTLIPFEVPFVAIVVCYAFGVLTVTTAAVATIAGSLLALVPALPLLIRSRPVFRGALARRGIKFGLKSWVGGLAQMANLRLDQLLMITAVGPRELGLYAVATTLAGAPLLAIGALTPPLMARVAGGQIELMSRAVRLALAATVTISVPLALVTPMLLTVLFGPEFRGAVPMALLLLAANVPFAGAMVLSSALQADGAPVIPSIGEGLALVITVVGLLVLLRPLGGIGAAIVSLAAYGTSFVFQLVVARRRTGTPLGQFLLPTLTDARWAQGLIADVTLRFRVRAEGASAR